MLSPASLRVCCLAVMAPALTKADRRAECLPVALSDPYCDSKTLTPYNRKDKYIEANFPKLSTKFASLLSNRRKAYVYKSWYRTHFKNTNPELCFRSIPVDLHNGKTNAESQSETWHGTSVTLAVADKVRRKYTMNKNFSTLKNMGLARTSVSLNSMKKGNRITQFSPKDRENPSTPDVGESSPDLPDSTNSELNTELLITRIAETSSEQCPGDVTSSSGDAVLSSAVEQNSSSEGAVTLPIACASPAAEAASENCSITLPSVSSDVNSVSVSKDLNYFVPVTLTGSECATSNSADPVEPDVAPVAAEQSISHETHISHNSNSQGASLKETVAPSENSSDVTIQITNDGSSPAPKSEIFSIQTSITDSFTHEILNFQPDDFLISSCPSQTMGVKKFASIAQLSFGKAVESKIQRRKVPKKKKCCWQSLETVNLLNKKYDQGVKRILAAVEKSELLLRICLSAYSKKEIGELFQSYQHKLGIPCQYKLRKSIKPPAKDMVDLKAELLQSEDVKSLSTSALVNLVRRLESSGSPGNLLPSQNISISGIDASSDAAVLAFAPEDIADVIHTSRELLTNIKEELRCVDPDLTESSDEGESDLDSQENESDHKMALWKYMKERAALTCRSTWLIARIHELENQLRTAMSILLKLASSVGNVCFEEEFSSSETAAALSIAGSGDASSQTKKVKGLSRPVNGYLDHSNINNVAHIGQNACFVETLNLKEESVEQCSRTRALNISAFQKRDVLVTTGLHLTDSKLSKLSSIGCYCSCREEALPCVLCMGRYQCIQSSDPDTVPLLDRVSLLDSNFHPLLSFQKDVPLVLHFENILKKNESQYQIARPVSPVPSNASLDLGTKPTHFNDVRSRSQKLRRYARTLSAKYRNKHVRDRKHLRKHGLVFGNWRRFRNRNSFPTRDSFRRISIDSSASSHDSPVPSPGSVFEDGFDNLRRRRDDNQYDINDVIIPYSNKSVRLVEFEFKDIIVPSFRLDENEPECPPHQNSSDLNELLKDENMLDEAYLTRHDPLEIEEKKINKRPDVMNLLGPNPKRPRREHRFDSRADSSGANTPDLFGDADIFQDNSSMTAAPTPPAFSPPATPCSTNFISDDSQPPFNSSLASRFDRKKLAPVKRPSEDNSNSAPLRQLVDTEEVAPYELRTFPLSNEQYEEIAMDPYGEDTELTVSGPSSPASPGSTTMSTSTIEEDITDPEWMVLRNNPIQESPGLKLKLAKR